MEFSLGGTTDASQASVRTDGRATADPQVIPVEAADSADVMPEFWDACWTLEDEWIPRAVVRPGPRPRHKRTKQLPEVFALL